MPPKCYDPLTSYIQLLITPTAAVCRPRSHETAAAVTATQQKRTPTDTTVMISSCGSEINEK